MTEPPRLQRCHTTDEEAWQRYGTIIFWLHRTGVAEEDVTARCLPYWRRLTTDLVPAAVDALYWLSRPDIATVAENRPVLRKLIALFRAELRAFWSGALRMMRR